jgi:hypothetical protein
VGQGAFGGAHGPCQNQRPELDTLGSWEVVSKWLRLAPVAPSQLPARVGILSGLGWASNSEA